MKLEERQKLFENPTSPYRGKPFWSWNGKLEEAELKRQIDVMKEMGFGGFFMHSRTGLETEYLGDEWFRLINECADYGNDKKMEAWLYDEDRWPSGSAGGLATENPRYRAMFIEMNIFCKKEWSDSCRSAETAGVFACRLNDGIFSEKRKLAEGNELEEGETAVLFKTRYSVCNDNYNGFSYLNTMDREAVEKFIEITHEKYRENCKDRLGKEIFGIFTDEPHRGGVFTCFAEGAVNAAPYTPGMFEQFETRFGYSLKENLPELFLRRKKGEMSRVTRDYFELCQELFLECFAIPVAQWCRKNHMIFTGHVLHEDSLCCQAVMQGSLMRFYEYMDYPGMDLLGEFKTCYWAAKQVDSVARQLKKEWVLSELYGCTGWQMNFESYKNVGDWQALFGVNLRCPHLSWYTMKGEGKRDYPASILHQSSWYPEYRYVEDYFSRIHAALHGAKARCGLLVINPIESVWARAYSGAFERLVGVDGEIERLERQYADVFHMLEDNHIDFDYGEEDILSRHSRVENGVLYVGECGYSRVLVVGVDTIRNTTLELLKQFADQDGTVVFAGEIPAYVDVMPSDAVQRLASSCTWIPLEENAVAAACRSGDEVVIASEYGKSVFARSFDMEGGRMVMLLNMDRKNGFQGLEICLGEGSYLERWDPRTGSVTEAEFRGCDGKICAAIDLEAGGERLYRIADQKRVLPMPPVFEGGEAAALPDHFHYRLSEKNICVLDMVEVTGEDGMRLPSMEILKADRAVKDRLNLPYRGGAMLQPWYQMKDGKEAEKRLEAVTLNYPVEIKTIPAGIRLVTEDLAHIRQIFVNGVEIERKSAGKWIDICFDEIILPDGVLKTGSNAITLVMEYNRTSGIEAIYLLGDFGVELKGGKPVLTELPKLLAVGDISVQGLPFYSGSVTYEMDGFEEVETEVTAGGFGGAMVKLVGENEAALAFAPYRATVRALREIHVVLTRRNTFGPLHMRDKYASGYDPNSFVTEGENWTDDYVLYEQGLLEKPVILVFQ